MYVLFDMWRIAFVFSYPRTAQFGALSDELYGTSESSTAGQWYVIVLLRDDGVASPSKVNHIEISREAGIVEYRQDPIPKSEYQTRLDKSELEDDADEDHAFVAESHQIRFWSDYSRVYLHPRTTHRLPDLADWEAADGDWLKSREAFQQYNAVRELWFPTQVLGI